MTPALDAQDNAERAAVRDVLMLLAARIDELELRVQRIEDEGTDAEDTLSET